MRQTHQPAPRPGGVRGFHVARACTLAADGVDLPLAVVLVVPMSVLSALAGVAPLPPGLYTILIELADADHKVLAKEVVRFEVPRTAAGGSPAR